MIHQTVGLIKSPKRRGFTMKIYRKRIRVLLTVLLLPAMSFAGSSEKCEVIHWQPDHVYTLTGSINYATHITMPVSSSVDPVVGNSDRESSTGLWHVEYRQGQNNLFFKPTDKRLADGSQTNMTYVGDDGNSYEFILKRVDQPKYVCVVIEKNGGLMDGSWSHYQTPNQRLMKLLSVQLHQQNTQITRSDQQIISQQRKALSAYRSHIYTDYTWSGRGDWWGTHDVNSVYDDGRWTYIRLNTDNKGVMSVYGIVSGHQELLQYHYDAQNKVYRISGIYPALVLIYDKNTLNQRNG
jgi:type IV secretory pathway VirB9-like protein